MKKWVRLIVSLMILSVLTPCLAAAEDHQAMMDAVMELVLPYYEQAAGRLRSPDRLTAGRCLLFFSKENLWQPFVGSQRFLFFIVFLFHCLLDGKRFNPPGSF